MSPCHAGDVKEFGFREIPDDDNYHSSFSAAIPEAEEVTAEASDNPKDMTPPLDEPSDEGAAKADQSTSWFSGTSKKAASWMPWSKKEELVRLTAPILRSIAKTRLFLALAYIGTLCAVT